MHSPRYNQTLGSSFACALGGKVYAFHHSSQLPAAQRRPYQAMVEAYDPSTDAWTILPDIDRDVYHVNVLNDQFLCALHRSNWASSRFQETNNWHFSMYDSDLVLLVRLELGVLRRGFTPCAVGAAGMLLLVGGTYGDFAGSNMSAIQIMTTRGWHHTQHRRYLAPLQDAVRAVLLSQQRLARLAQPGQANATRGLPELPEELWLLTFAFLDDSHFFSAGGGVRVRATRA